MPVHGDRYFTRRYLVAVFIEEHWLSYGYAPTVTRIAEAFGLSPLTIEYHISRLLGEGRLTLDQSPAVQWLRVA